VLAEPRIEVFEREFGLLEDGEGRRSARGCGWSVGLSIEDGCLKKFVVDVFGLPARTILEPLDVRHAAVLVRDPSRSYWSRIVSLDSEEEITVGDFAYDIAVGMDTAGEETDDTWNERTVNRLGGAMVVKVEAQRVSACPAVP